MLRARVCVLVSPSFSLSLSLSLPRVLLVSLFFFFKCDRVTAKKKMPKVSHTSPPFRFVRTLPGRARQTTVRAMSSSRASERLSLSLSNPRVAACGDGALCRNGGSESGGRGKDATRGVHSFQNFGTSLTYDIVVYKYS